MRGAVAAFLVVGVFASTAISAEGEPKLRGAGGALGGFGLIVLPSVHKELKLEPAQISRAKAVSDEMKGKFNETMKALQPLEPTEQLKKLPAMAESHYEEGMKELAKFLKPAQIDRFDQILFQQRGAAAMLEPAPSKVLKLTEAQAKEVGGLIDAAKDQQRKIYQAAKGDMKTALPKLQAITTETNTKAVALLADDQKKAWHGLTGEPFTVDAKEASSR